MMAYGDISPQSPLSMMSSSQPTTQQSSTSVSTSERTTPLVNEGDQSLIGHSSPFPDVPSQPGQAHSIPRSWSRSQSRSASSSRPISGMDRSRNQTPVSVFGKIGVEFGVEGASQFHERSMFFHCMPPSLSLSLSLHDSHFLVSPLC